MMIFVRGVAAVAATQESRKLQHKLSSSSPSSTVKTISPCSADWTNNNKQQVENNSSVLLLLRKINLKSTNQTKIKHQIYQNSPESTKILSVPCIITIVDGNARTVWISYWWYNGLYISVHIGSLQHTQVLTTTITSWAYEYQYVARPEAEDTAVARPGPTVIACRARRSSTLRRREIVVVIVDVGYCVSSSVAAFSRRQNLVFLS